MEHLGKPLPLTLRWKMPVQSAVAALVVLCLLLPGNPMAALAQSTAGTGATTTGAPGIQVEESVAQANFGAETREIRFAVRARSDERIRSVQLLYYVDDSNVQNVATPTFQPGTAVVAGYVWRVAGVLAPGSEIRYEWQLETESGRKLTTSPQSVSFNDTRFTWRESQGDQITVFSAGSDAQTGTSLLNEAKKTQTKLRTDYGLSLEKPVRIYAYTREQDYASALASGARQLSPVMTVGTDRIFVFAPGTSSSGQITMSGTLQGLRREMANAVFLQKTENPYSPPPRWLSEGFAYFMSGEVVSENNYKALGQLATANKLLPLRALNGNFPTTDREQALANAESLSVVKWMYDTYSADKVKATLAAFKEGNTVDDALKKGLGVTLEQMEGKWKSALKSGSAAKTAPASKDQNSGPVIDGGPLDSMFGPAVQYWRGIFGPNAQYVILGVGGFVGLGVLAVVGSTVFSVVRSARAQDDD